MRKLKSKKNLIIIALISVVVLGLGGTFAFFTFYKPVEAFVLTMNGVPMQVEFKEGTNVIDNPYAYPISDSFAKENLSKLGYVDFKVSGGTPNNEYLYYELYLTEENGNTLDSNFIKVYLTDENNQEVVSPSIYNSLSQSKSENTNGKILYNETLTGIFEKTYRLYVWIDSTYSQNTEHQTFAFKINLYAYNTEKPKVASDTIKEQIISHTADGSNLTVEDEDGTIYLSGTNEQINFNYVWYSGKLWRITAIYPDNTMKMITQDTITSIRWNTDTTYSKTAWIYQWLNEDFLDTLENQANIIVQNAKWNANKTASKTSKPDETEETTVPGKVGLLNSYEYYQSYKNISSDFPYQSGYLNIGYNWWLLTPYINIRDGQSYVRYVSDNGFLGGYSPYSSEAGVRPSVNLKSDILISGGGTKENPYRIEGDKEVAQVNDKLNSRVSGEYVNFDGKKYRIVGIENDTTKLTSVDYVRDGSGSVMTKYFSSVHTDVLYGSGTTTGTDNWAGYLNDTSESGWYGSISETYKKMLVQGTYYLGYGGGNYKTAICSESNTTDTTKECNKTSSTWTGYVGLPRMGEMFSAQLGEGKDSSSTIWLITPCDASYNLYVWYLSNDNGLERTFPTSGKLGVRPSINLKSDVLISGKDGTFESPYEIKCDSCVLD